VANLNYVVAELADGSGDPLCPAWPALHSALAELEQPGLSSPSPPRYCQRVACTLTNQPATRNLLLLAGFALILVSLSCFYRLR